MLMRAGPVRACPRKPNGNMRRARRRSGTGAGLHCIRAARW
jgi:hypothetical protein